MAKPQTRPIKSTQAILDDARYLLGVAKANLAAFKKADAGKKIKTVDASLLASLAKNIDLAAKTAGDVAATKVAAASATGAEAAARKKLAEALIAIRDDVKNAYPDDPAIGRAFGAGARLGPQSTSALLTVASAVASAYGDKSTGFGARAKDAGVTPARVAAVSKQAAALASADQAQRTQQGARKGGVLDKKSVITAITKDVARIRTVAKSVFRKSPTILAAFASTAPRKAVKKRPPKPAPPPTT